MLRREGLGLFTYCSMPYLQMVIPNKCTTYVPFNKKKYIKKKKKKIEKKNANFYFYFISFFNKRDTSRLLNEHIVTVKNLKKTGI
jgi:cytochrome oxidase Cu insertion factor (SCO1/SenC/PrrC family)